MAFSETVMQVTSDCGSYVTVEDVTYICKGMKVFTVTTS